MEAAHEAQMANVRRHGLRDLLVQMPGITYESLVTGLG